MLKEDSNTDTEEVLDQVSAASTTAATTAETIKLRTAIAKAVAIDGGACLVTTLKEYLIPDIFSSNKQLDNHLVAASRAAQNQTNSRGRLPKAKLLSFLEQQSDLFRVNRNEVPHWVCLVTADGHDASAIDKAFQDAILYVSSPRAVAKAEEMMTKLIEKIRYVMRRNQARTERRRAKRRLQYSTDFQTPSVTLLWLLRQCTWEFHFLARECGLYIPASLWNISSSPSLLHFKPINGSPIYKQVSDVKEVGSKEWESAVIDSFQNILVKHAGSALYVEADRVYLRFHKEEEGVEERQLVSKIDEVLTSILMERDGGHQVSLALLLTRYDDLRLSLGGRDLWELYQQYSDEFFHEINIVQVDHDLILQSKHPKTITSSSSSLPPNDDEHREFDQTKRMLVDEVGLYSIANGKWGKSMANILIREIEKSNLYSTCVAVADESTTRPVRCVADLTSGVGGMTLGLAKSRYFDKVIAVEIDSDRARFCRENMIKHGQDAIVEVRNADSNLVIPHFQRQMSFVIDCPWGGYGYKREGGTIKLFLGSTPLDEVVLNLAQHCSPCIIGLRLPVNFLVDPFLQTLKSAFSSIQCVTVAKLQVQLFVVLYSCISAS